MKNGKIGIIIVFLVLIVLIATCIIFIPNKNDVELLSIKSEKELKRSIDLYIKFYNEKRPHSMLRYQTPTNYDNAYFKRHK